MPAATRLGDTSTGHQSWPPRANDSASPNVFVNNKPWHRLGDHWLIHCNPACHDGVLSSGSSTVFINGKKAGRVGDEISCTDRVATGSPDVFAGG